MTPDAFRALALQLPGAIEDSHMGHPDFRVNGRIFATLGPKPDHAMVKLPPDEQQDCVRRHRDAFEPISGAWGARGATRVFLSAAEEETVKRALTSAWRTVSEATTRRPARAPRRNAKPPG